MTSQRARTQRVHWLTLAGKAATPPFVKGMILDYPGHGHFVVDRVERLADGSWQAVAVRKLPAGTEPLAPEPVPAGHR